MTPCRCPDPQVGNHCLRTPELPFHWQNESYCFLLVNLNPSSADHTLSSPLFSSPTQGCWRGNLNVTGRWCSGSKAAVRAAPPAGEGSSCSHTTYCIAPQTHPSNTGHSRTDGKHCLVMIYFTKHKYRFYNNIKLLIRWKWVRAPSIRGKGFYMDCVNDLILI